MNIEKEIMKITKGAKGEKIRESLFTFYLAKQSRSPFNLTKFFILMKNFKILILTKTCRVTL